MMAGHLVCLRPPWVGAVGFLAWREWKMFSVIAGCWMVPFSQRSWRGGCLVMISIRRCGLSCIWPPLLLSCSEIATLPSNVTLGVAFVFLVMLHCPGFRGPSRQHRMTPFQAQQCFVLSFRNKKIEIAINEHGRARLNAGQAEKKSIGFLIINRIFLKARGGGHSEKEERRRDEKKRRAFFYIARAAKKI